MRYFARRSTVVGDIRSQRKRSFQVRWFRTVRIAEEVQTLHERATVLRYIYIACFVDIN